MQYTQSFLCLVKRAMQSILKNNRNKGLNSFLYLSTNVCFTISGSFNFKTKEDTCDVMLMASWHRSCLPQTPSKTDYDISQIKKKQNKPCQESFHWWYCVSVFGEKRQTVWGISKERKQTQWSSVLEEQRHSNSTGCHPKLAPKLHSQPSII